MREMRKVKFQPLCCPQRSFVLTIDGNIKHIFKRWDLPGVRGANSGKRGLPDDLRAVELLVLPDTAIALGSC